MAFRDSPFEDLKVPVAWTGAISAVIMACVALGLLLTDNRDQADGGAYGSARGEFSEVMRPVSGLLAAPMRGLGSLGEEVRGYFFAVSENRRLKARVKELERIRDDAVALRNINARYEQLLQLRTEPPVPMVTARVVTDARGPFSNARLADAGRDRGVKVGYPVLSDHGVVGRVVGVAHNASRVLLLTDVDSRTPVLVDRTNARAILTGDGGSAPRLEYLRGVNPVKQGDVILTSGDGGMFPRGLPVGVAARDVRGGWRVRLYAEAQDVDYVRILQFDDFSKVVNQAELNARVLPPLPAADAAQLALATAARAAPPKTPAAAPKAPAASPAGGVSAPPAAVKATPSAKPPSTKAAPSPGTTSASSTSTGGAKTPSASALKPAAAKNATTVTKAKPAAAKRPKLAPATERMAPIPDDYRGPAGGGAR